MVNKEKSIQEKTAAESKSIGFDYQYYYLLYQMLQLENGQTVGYEVKDDIHIDKPNGKQILVQLKHSVETKADGKIVNLTKKDEALWKTISNWIKIIKDKAENRTSIDSQMKFIDKTYFQLITNKSYSVSNEFVKKLNSFKNGKLTISGMKNHLTSLCTPLPGKERSEVDNYIHTLEIQDDTWLTEFLQKVSIEQNMDDLIERIKMRIKEKNVADTRLDDVFSSIDSNLKRMIYEDVKARNKVEITFDEYHKNFTRYFELGRGRKLPIRLGSKKISVPDNAVSHISIRQLMDSDILSELDDEFEETLIRIFTSKYEMNNHLESWIQQSEITEEERRCFEEESIIQWTNTFNSTYASLKRTLREKNISEINRDDLFELTSACYHKTLELKLSIDDTELVTSMSNGQFYLLSDKPSIGWHFGWKGRYKT